MSSILHSVKKLGARLALGAAFLTAAAPAMASGGKDSTAEQAPPREETQFEVRQRQLNAATDNLLGPGKHTKFKKTPAIAAALAERTIDMLDAADGMEIDNKITTVEILTGYVTNVEQDLTLARTGDKNIAQQAEALAKRAVPVINKTRFDIIDGLTGQMTDMVQPLLEDGSGALPSPALVADIGKLLLRATQQIALLPPGATPDETAARQRLIDSVTKQGDLHYQNIAAAAFADIGNMPALCGTAAPDVLQKRVDTMDKTVTAALKAGGLAYQNIFINPVSDGDFEKAYRETVAISRSLAGNCGPASKTPAGPKP